MSDGGRPLRHVSAAIAITVAVLASATIEIFSTSAQSSATLVGVSYPFSGANLVFEPEIAPVVSPTVLDDSVALAWPAVTLSTGLPVAYRVTRTPSIGSAGMACIATTNSCSDLGALAGVSYTYSQQPTASGTFWGAPASVSSTTIIPPNWKFGQLGTFSVSTGITAQSVPYPAGVAAGDILLLVAVSANRNAPNVVPAGWTQLISQSANSPGGFSLFVAWRIADSGTSVSFESRATATGAFATVLNYGHAFSSVATPVVAHTAVQSSIEGAVQTFTPPTNITTNAIATKALSIVAVRANNALTLSNAAGYTVRGSNAQVVGAASTAISVAIADTLVQASGTTPTAPTWSQSGTPAQWISGLVAFA